VKDIAETSWWKIPAILAETAAQAKAAQADFGVLVIRRPGHAHPSEWWAHMYLSDLLRLVVGVPQDVTILHFPIRFELQELLPLLSVAGYGTPPADEEVTA
jgi:hypothetical protein